MPPASHYAIRQLQPFTRVGVGGARFHHLWLLDRMWNTDKHRALVLALGSSSTLRPSDWSKPVVVRWVSIKGFGKSGPICRVFAHGERNVRYPARLAFRIGFGDGGPYQNGILVIPNLARLYRFVRDEPLPALRPFL